MKVNFVTRGGPHLASYRLRIDQPAAYLREMGWEVVVGPCEPADAHVFSKHWDYGDQGWARESPCPIFDLCDDWFGREHDSHYRKMCNLCSVVVSSRRLGEIVLGQTGRLATYIPEAYELADGVVRAPRNVGSPVVLWFGHSSNLPTVQPYFDIPRLLVCTNATGKGVVPYSPGNLRQCLDYCDLVLIPQEKDWKSANRMVESIRAGRFVVAADIPAYRGFGAYLGDIREGLEWVKRNDGNIMERIIFGRNAISSFSPEAVGKMWFDFISAAATRSSVATGT
jgi:hypothetical protein